MEKAEKARENRLRRKAVRFGLILTKSLVRSWSINNHLGYKILNADTNEVKWGEKYELSLDDVEKLLDEYFEKELKWDKVSKEQ